MYTLFPMNNTYNTMVLSHQSGTKQDKPAADWFNRYESQKDDLEDLGRVFRKYLSGKDDPYILDVDLDFFSTRNPFRGLYERAGLYDTLRELYRFQRPDLDQDDKVLASLSLSVRRLETVDDDDEEEEEEEDDDE
uniref:Uncharacterized protein n=1 Tax=Timema cristinae TaxID=61476 RepID=A0A7R9DF28_TIMCR|nr:unnamed protein product [Timema cristinae]